MPLSPFSLPMGSDLVAVDSTCARIIGLNPEKLPYLSDGGAWVNASDRDLKTDFHAIDALQILARIDAMPVTQWRYKSQTDELHVGPVAQDFYAAFGLGADDRHIATVDEAGIALAAIQALHTLVLEKDASIAAQQDEIRSLRDRIAHIETMLERAAH